MERVLGGFEVEFIVSLCFLAHCKMALESARVQKMIYIYTYMYLHVSSTNNNTFDGNTFNCTCLLKYLKWKPLSCVFSSSRRRGQIVFSPRV